MPFPGYDYGANLSPEDSRLLFESIERLNAAEPSRVGRAESWSNPQTKSSGTSKITRIFRSGGMPCHRVRTHIAIAGQTPGRDYRLTWCRTSTGEWKSKG
jgi:surface antigen